MLSRYAYIASVALMCYASFFFYPRWNKWTSEAAISWDVSGYYWYLPSIFIYHDLKGQSFKDSVMAKYQPTNNDFQQGIKLENGAYAMKYSSGMAVMYLPFFTAAHLLAGPLGYPRDGFSRPYQFAIQLGGFLISILGLWYLRRLLLYFYTDAVVAVTMLLLVFGSNYLNYAAIDNGMSHCWLFTIYVFILLNTHYFYQAFRMKYAVRIGLLIGLATLTRPTDALSCIIPLLWGMDSLSFGAIKRQLQTIARHFKPLLVAVLCAVCVVSLQLIYWKYVSGHWLVYSYADQHLYFRHPNIYDYTVSYRSGWLVYAPMMVFAFIGIVPFLFSGRNKVAILAFFLLNYYMVCSWNIWWYGGRAMVQSYPVLLFPMASLVDAALRKKVIAWMLAPFALLFLYFNTWITWQYHRGSLYDPDNMTKRYYQRVVGRWNAPERTLQLRDNTDLFEGQPAGQRLLFQDDFEKDTGVYYNGPAIDGARSLWLSKDRQVTPTISLPFSGDGDKWLRVAATFRTTGMESYLWKMPQFVVRLIDKSKTGNDRIVKENMVRVDRFLSPGQPREVDLDMLLPAQHYDSINIWFWNADSDKDLAIDDIKVWAFK